MSKHDFNAWIGKTETASDIIDARAIELMPCVYEGFRGQGENYLPPLWHWLYFPNSTPLADMGNDGHSKLGGFLPPIELPRRMWAGGRLQFHKPINIGERIEKSSTIKSISQKSGRSGELCFVTVVHELSNAAGLCLTEEHDIVYRQLATGAIAGEIQTNDRQADWMVKIHPDPVMLFRYSALTFNAHRIHYDRDYCQRVEGYQGLVFHGPLTATLLVNLAIEKNSGRKLRSFEFKAQRPLFDTSPFEIAISVGMQDCELWANTPDGQLAMSAQAKFDV